MQALRLAIFLPLIFSCASSSASLWQPYIFDGTGFSPAGNRPAKAFWLRTGHLPVTAAPSLEPAAAEKLPPGTGAVAGLCYIQTTAGRISEHNLVAPYPDEQITFLSKISGSSVTRTDKDGFFIEYLPAGDYELFCRGVRKEFRVKQGETTLVPIRGGKRMAD